MLRKKRRDPVELKGTWAGSGFGDFGRLLFKREVGTLVVQAVLGKNGERASAKRFAGWWRTRV